MTSATTRSGQAPLRSQPSGSASTRPSIAWLWWNGLVAPRRAFGALATRPAPGWGFAIVVAFNLAISLTTTLPRYLMGEQLVMGSALTFVPTNDYLLYEVFFLPPLRVLHWVLSAAVVHLVLRLIRHPGGFDALLNIGGLGYLVVMPAILVSDWILLGLGRYDLAEITHALSLPWSWLLSVIGLREVLRVRPRTAWIVVVGTTPLTLPLLAIFAR